jgi:hypothetical protein
MITRPLVRRRTEDEVMQQVVIFIFSLKSLFVMVLQSWLFVIAVTLDLLVTHS